MWLPLTLWPGWPHYQWTIAQVLTLYLSSSDSTTAGREVVVVAAAGRGEVITARCGDVQTFYEVSTDTMKWKRVWISPVVMKIPSSLLGLLSYQPSRRLGWLDPSWQRWSSRLPIQLMLVWVGPVFSCCFASV